ncbi:MAG: dTDP-4-amino-4,6-dideoxygalactose transaminase [Eubacteriales bacterium]
MIKFNVPPYVGKEVQYIREAIENNQKLCGDGLYTRKCNKWFEENFQTPKVLLTTSCTHALEMAAILIDIQPEDEVIMPSYTFVSTANAFVLRGAKIVFVDIRPDTMNIDENLIEDAITDKTKAIVPVHYAGVACEMDKIMHIAKKHKIYVIEDAAQGVMSTYKGKALGTIGYLGCFSFHETKNYTMGEGGALLINNKKFVERAEIIREKGTNRSKFIRGQIDKYTWVDLGSSYLPSDINAALLYAQLEKAEGINDYRLKIWETYYKRLIELAEEDLIELPYIPKDCEHNAHMFYIKCKDIEERTKLIKFLKEEGIQAVFHYIPLHSSIAGQDFGQFNGEDKYTTKESEKLLRLPLYYFIEKEDTYYIISKIYEFYYKVLLEFENDKKVI